MLLLFVSGLVIGWALFFRSPEIITPDYPAGDTEENQIPVGGTPEDKIEVSEGGGGVGLTYSVTATLSLTEGKLTLYLMNPSRSTQDMVLQVCIDDLLVAESARITPGHKLVTLDIESGVALRLRPGKYDATYLIHYFDTESNEKSIVITEATNIIITVVE